jgi:hypothetical protein
VTLVASAGFLSNLGRPKVLFNIPPGRTTFITSVTCKQEPRCLYVEGCTFLLHPWLHSAGDWVKIKYSFSAG